MSTSPLTPTPLSRLRVSRHHIPPHALIPNSGTSGSTGADKNTGHGIGTGKPLLIYHSAFPPASTTAPSAVEAHLRAVGAVAPQWRYTMYPTTHFHSTTHEVLVVTRGAARLCFGGEANPGKVEETLSRGDVVVVPAGVGHRLLEDLSNEEEDEGGFEMVGSYPPGCGWDMCYGKPGEEDKVARIRELAWFARDPIYGDEGPVLEV